MLEYKMYWLTINGKKKIINNYKNRKITREEQNLYLYYIILYKYYNYIIIIMGFDKVSNYM